MKQQVSGTKDSFLDAFDTLFNKRDYAAAEKFWSPDYIQHSAHIRAGARRIVQSREETSRRP